MFYQYFNVIDAEKISKSEMQLSVHLEVDASSMELNPEEPDLWARRRIFEKVHDEARIAKENDMEVERNIPIASIITAYARCLLYSYILVNPGVRAMDTDGGVWPSDLNPNDMSNTVLGKMKRENNVKEGWFAAAKLYSYVNDEGQTTFRGKGISKSDRSSMGIDIMRNIIENNIPITSTSTQWLRDRTNYTITQREIEKSFAGSNLKRLTITNDDKDHVIGFIPLNIIRQRESFRFLLAPARMTITQFNTTINEGGEYDFYIGLLDYIEAYSRTSLILKIYSL